MKKNLLLLLAFLLAASFKSFATHDIGGEISYQCVAPNSYLVTYKHYTWGNWTSAINLTLKSPGCNAGRVLPMTKISQNFVQAIPNPMGYLNNYSISVYTANVTFSATEKVCPDWQLQISGPSVGQSSSNMTTYFDIKSMATLKLGNNINNSSPAFDTLNYPVLLASEMQLNQLSVAASDFEGDSLSYELVAPLDDYYQPRTNYRNLPFTSSGYFPNPNPPAPYCNVCPGGMPPNPQFGFFPGAPSIYSPTFPLPSFIANWNAIDPATGTPYQFVPVNKYFKLDSLTGSLSFIPAKYDSFAVHYYLVSFRINEFRKVNGLTTKIGSIRRETLIIVGDPGTNQNPTRAGILYNNQPLQAGTEIRIKPGTPLNLKFATADLNASDILTLKSNANTILQGSTFSVSSGNRPTGTVTWTPTAAQVRSQPYYLSFKVTDNASPVHGTHVETIAVRVSNTGGIAGLTSGMADLGFKVYPNPFSEVVNFKFNSTKPATEIRIYNLLGQQVDVIKVTGNENDIRWEKAAGFASGTYVAKLITTDNSVQTLKFSKLQ